MFGKDKRSHILTREKNYQGYKSGLVLCDVQMDQGLKTGGF